MDRRIAEGAHDMEAMKDASHLYEVERRARHAVRPGFRITELQISPTQEVPWHYHNNIHDTFYVLSGAIRILLSNPPEEVRLMPGQTYVAPLCSVEEATAELPSAVFEAVVTRANRRPASAPLIAAQLPLRGLAVPWWRAAPAALRSRSCRTCRSGACPVAMADGRWRQLSHRPRP